VYSDISLVLDWTSEGAVLKAKIVGEYGNVGKRIYNEEYYFRPGLTWPLRTNGLSFRVLPAGCLFGHKGPAVFVEDDAPDKLLALVGLANSSTFGILVALQLARTELAQSYEVGLIQTTPVPDLGEADRAILSILTRRAWKLRRWLDSWTETSHAYSSAALLNWTDVPISAGAEKFTAKVSGVEDELANIQAEIDERCRVLYGISDADHPLILEALVSNDSGADLADLRDDEGEFNETNSIAGTGLVAGLASWTVGVSFGRFDVRLVTGVRPMPLEPDPFDLLPICAPGVLQGHDGLPIKQPPAGYPISFPEDGVLIDDPGQARDLVAVVRSVFDVVVGTDSESWWRDVAGLLDPKGHDLRDWLAGSFFEYHLKLYSKSRRKAPIYWQLATPSASYSVWLYSHRISRDTFFQLQNDIVGPKVLHEERQLDSFREQTGTNPSARERKEIANQETFVEELRTMLDEIKRVAPLWNPNLDDGIVLVMAPLWRLVPQHKAWQKELKSKWDELQSGKYDWAHLAMHLWPERVVPKCATDRSFAIAHGLEDEFWFEESPGKWKPRTEPTRPIAELIAERSSPAVKAALHSLQNAPVAPARSSKKGSR
jgi:hypothetical protein